MTYHIGFAFCCIPRLYREPVASNQIIGSGRGQCDRRRRYEDKYKSAMRYLVLLIPLFLSACFLVPHKVEVQQGNYVDQEMMSKLKLDMTRSQVLFVLGTPLVTDAFHPERWDYVYLTGRAGDVDRERGITVVFSENRLVRIEGDVALLRAAPALQVDTADQ